MLILFDQGTPVGIRRALIGDTVKTAYEMGWSTLVNGKLLNAAEAEGFELLVTTDKNFPHQQNFKTRRLGMVILSQNRWKLVKAAMPRIVAAIRASEPGTCNIVDI